MIEHEDIILQKFTDAILQPANLTWDATVESAILEQPLPGARKWAKTIPETLVSFNELVHIWTQSAQQTVSLDFARQVVMPTHHVIL